MKPLWRTTERKECCYSMYSRKVWASGNKSCIHPAKMRLILGNRFVQYFIIDGENLLWLSCNISTQLKKCNYRIHALSRYRQLHKSDSARSYWRARVRLDVLMTQTISPVGSKKRATRAHRSQAFLRILQKTSTWSVSALLNSLLCYLLTLSYTRSSKRAHKHSLPHTDGKLWRHIYLNNFPIQQNENV